MKITQSSCLGVWWYHYSGVWLRNLEECVSQMPLCCPFKHQMSLVNCGKCWPTGIYNYVFWKQNAWTVTHWRKNWHPQLKRNSALSSVGTQRSCGDCELCSFPWKIMQCSEMRGLGDGSDLNSSPRSAPLPVRHWAESAAWERFLNSKVEQWHLRLLSCYESKWQGMKSVQHTVG